MNGPTRRVLFNPTGLPGLRSQRTYYQNAKSIPRKFPARGTNRGLGIRRESGLTGENQSGHISAHPNEAILFFDSQTPDIAQSREVFPLTIDRSLSFETELGAATTLASRAKPSRSAMAIQQLKIELNGANGLGQASYTR
jgi:hypothetical protein